jgi:hypothetical protein
MAVEKIASILELLKTYSPLSPFSRWSSHTQSSVCAGILDIISKLTGGDCKTLFLYMFSLFLTTKLLCHFGHSTQEFTVLQYTQNYTQIIVLLAPPLASRLTRRKRKKLLLQLSIQLKNQSWVREI